MDISETAVREAAYTGHFTCSYYYHAAASVSRSEVLQRLARGQEADSV